MAFGGGFNVDQISNSAASAILPPPPPALHHQLLRNGVVQKYNHTGHYLDGFKSYNTRALEQQTTQPYMIASQTITMSVQKTDESESGQMDMHKPGKLRIEQVWAQAINLSPV